MRTTSSNALIGASIGLGNDSSAPHTTPLGNWVSVGTSHFDSSGNFSFINPIAPGELQRYSRIRTP